MLADFSVPLAAVVPGAVLLGAVLLGAVVQGATGFGFALVSAPVVMLVRPDLIPGPMIVTGLALSLTMAAKGWRRLEGAAPLMWILLGVTPGFLLGAWALAILPARETALLFGAMVLLAVGLSLSGLRIVPRPAAIAVAGLFSGFMGITTTMGGPPLALLFQHLPGERLRALLAASFALNGLLSLVILYAAGLFDAHGLAEGLLFTPGVLAGYLLARPAARWLDRGWTRPAVLLLAGLSGLMVILRASS